MKKNDRRKGLVVGLSVIAVITALGGLAWALNGTWTTKRSMPTARYGPAVGVVNGTAYAVGGYNGGCLKTVEAYDAGSDMWSGKTQMGTARFTPGVGVVNGTLYTVGGFDCSINPTNTVEAYNPSTNSWTPVASMSNARDALGVGVVNGTLYAVGGSPDGSHTTDAVEAYDPGTNTWSTKASMPTSRYDVAVGVVNGTLYAVGGFNGGSLNTVEAYNPATNMWSPKASLLTARDGPAVAVVNGLLFAAGGFSDHYLNTVEAYNPSTDTWTPVASMSTARYDVAGGVVNGLFYAVGGYNGTNPVATNEAFASPFFATFYPNLKIDFDANSFDLTGIFTLGATRSIDPLTQDVSVQVGSYSVTIPAGSFHRDSKGNFVFQGTINGVTLQASVTPHRGSNGVLYSFAVAGQGATNLPFRNPVTVGLTIGDNGRSANVTARFE
jgi:N-acetylneuraminic acid mutarotase